MTLSHRYFRQTIVLNIKKDWGYTSIEAKAQSQSLTFFLTGKVARRA
jgi:hypothetical protein